MRIRYFVGSPKHREPENASAFRLPPRAMVMDADEDPHAAIPEPLHKSLQDIAKTVSVPPRTWAKYLANGEHWGIIDMEFHEAERCMMDYKAGAATVEHVMQELCHLASAAVQARVYLMDQNKEN